MSEPAARGREVVEFESPLSGYMVAETIRRAYLPAILSTNEGNGDVGRLLAELADAYDEVVVPAVLSARLAGMLERRGYQREVHWTPEHEEYVECFVLRRVIPDATVPRILLSEHLDAARLAEHSIAETGVDSPTRPQHGKEDATP